MLVPSALVNRSQLDAEIQSIVQKLGTEVVHVTYRVHEDSTGDPAIFFRIVLPDAATQEATISDATEHIVNALIDELRPVENWGLHPYFNFRSQSDHEARKISSLD